MRVRFKLAWASPAGSARPGDVLDLPTPQAKQLISAGAAERYAGDPDPDLVPPAPESSLSDSGPLTTPSAPGGSSDHLSAESDDEAPEPGAADAPAGDDIASEPTPPPGSESGSSPAAPPPSRRPPLIPTKKK